MSDIITSNKPSPEGTAKIVYILYLVSIIIGITGLVGVIMAYVNKGDAPTWLKSHYEFQIRTFWIGVLYGLIGMLLLMVFIGFFILIFTMIWIIVRCVKGMKSLDQGTAHPNPTGWFF